MSKTDRERASSYLKDIVEKSPDIAVVLGSGLGDIAEAVSDQTVIPYSEIPGWPSATAPGHRGRLIFGEMSGRRVVMMQGRIHYYEGHKMDQVVFPVRVLHEIGVSKLFLTNATGGINLGYKPGELAAVYDHINMMGTNPLIGPNDDALGPRFPDMTYAYDRDYIELLSQVAKKNGITLHRAVYIAMSGPSYETPAEIRMARMLGADVVGMSTVPEVIAAGHLGMRVCAVSCITNYAAGLTADRLTHEEVLDRMSHASGDMLTIIRESIDAM